MGINFNFSTLIIINLRPVFQSKSNSNSQSHGHGQSYIVSYIELWLPFTSQSTRYFRWRGSRSRRERERDVAPVGPHSQDNKFINRERRRRPTKTSSLSENPSIRPSIREGKRANVFIPSARTEMNQLKLIELHRFSSSSPSSPGKKEKNTFITETGLIRIAHRLFSVSVLGVWEMYHICPHFLDWSRGLPRRLK